MAIGVLCQLSYTGVRIAFTPKCRSIGGKELQR